MHVEKLDISQVCLHNALHECRFKAIWYFVRVRIIHTCCCAPIGADTVVYLALLPPGTVEPNGEFLRDRQLKNWGQTL